MNKTIYKKDEFEGFKIRSENGNNGIKPIKGGEEFDPVVEENGVKKMSKTFTDVFLNGEEITKEEYEKTDEALEE